MPPLFILAAGAIGTAALVKLLAKESRRINSELDAARREQKATSDSDRANLARDPATGVYRPRDR